jgi:ankyrin repeat protein
LKHMEVAEIGGVSQLELLKKLQPGSKGIRRLRRSNHIFDSGYRTRSNGSEVMHMAAEMDLYETFRRALEEIKVKVDVVGGFYGTALQAAAARGHEKIVQLCLEHGADVNTVSGFFGTALQGAAAGGHEKIMRILLERGVDVNIVGGHYGTALQAAAAEGNEQVVQLLLEDGADVNITGGYYYTALHAAVNCNKEPIARILLEHGANVNARDGEWATALHTARRRTDNQACIDLLLEYEAEDHPPIEEILNWRQILQ